MGNPTDNDDGQSDLAARVTAVERAVAALDRRLAELDARAQSPATQQPRPALDRQPDFARPFHVPRRPAIADRRHSRTEAAADPGQWLNWLGIALVLFGVAFGFKYSIDRGWLGPVVRVCCGLGLGAALLVLSSLVRASRPGLSRLLAGGGIASAYISMFAAFQLYALVSHATAFTTMVVVTTAAFVLAVREDDAAMALLAAAGGLVTPFLLYTDHGSLPGLIGYTCLVIAAAAAVFARCGWRVLLWAATSGGWLILGAAAEQTAFQSSSAWQAAFQSSSDAVAVQVGVAFLALATWGLAVVRELLCAARPDQWPATRMGLWPETARIAAADDWTLQPHQLTLITPVLVLAATGAVWKLGEIATGFVALGLAAAWAAATTWLWRSCGETARRLAATHAAGAAVLLAFSSFLVLGDDARLVGLAAEALALLLLAARSGDRKFALLAHALFAGLCVATLQRLFDDVGHASPGLNASQIADLAVVVAVAAAARIYQPVQNGPDARRARETTSGGVLPVRRSDWFHAQRSRWAIFNKMMDGFSTDFYREEGRDSYAAAAQIGLLLWLLRALDPLDNGAAWVTAAWFSNAVALIVVGLRNNSVKWRRTGGAVMALTVAKLFVVDLSQVDAGWRIVTFLGFGGVLLGLGYAFPALWKRDAQTDTSVR